MYKTLFIYKIMVGELCYIGSTKDIRDRMIKHKNACYNENRRYNIKLYKTIREVYGDDWDNVNWSVIDCYYNVDKTFRKTIEQYYIDFFKSELNMYGAELNKEKDKQRKKQWYNDNKEEILEKRKIRYEEKKEEILQQQKQYYSKIREKINQKITCVCGSTISKKYKSRHEKSKKHQNYLLKIVK